MQADYCLILDIKTGNGLDAGSASYFLPLFAWRFGMLCCLCVFNHE
jgi:hypothetical protein